MTTIKTSLALPAEMVTRLDEEAEAAGISRAEVIRRAIHAYQDRGDPDQTGEDSGPVLAEGNRPAVSPGVCDRALLTAGAVLYLGFGIMAVAIARVLQPGER
jgi:predicted transcriptional regulator